MPEMSSRTENPECLAFGSDTTELDNITAASTKADKSRFTFGSLEEFLDVNADHLCDLLSDTAVLAQGLIATVTTEHTGKKMKMGSGTDTSLVVPDASEWSTWVA
jgi:hypothetical protein